MITTMGGNPVKILEGSRKSITGDKYFTVEVTEYPDIMRMFRPSRKVVSTVGKLRLKKSELRFDSEQELYDALNLVKN